MRTVLLVFGELNDQDIEWFSAHGTKRTLKEGSVLIQKGVPISDLFIVLTGELSVWISDKCEVSRARTGEILGEMSYLEARPPSATVKAARASTVLAVPMVKTREKLRTDAAFAARFYKALGMLLSFRLRRVTQKLQGEAEVDESVDELDPNVLDTVFLAGARFDRMMKRLA